MMIEYWNQYGYEQEPKRSKRKQTVERGDDQREQQVKQKYDPNIGTCDNIGTEVNEGEMDKRQIRN